VLRGAGEVSICYEDKDVVAFMDIQPVNAGHVLVVPREHFASLEDIPRVLATHLFDVAMELAPVVKHVSDADGLNILVNSGAAAGQDVFHFHVHVIPRCPDDGFAVPLPFAGSQMPDRTVLDANAARIIAALRDPVAHRPDRRVAGEDRRAPSR
jgi:histidine triad (HIT) family protein